MQEAHAREILHMDLKPDNILVRQEGGRWQVKIIDFGLSLRRQTVETSRMAGSAGSTLLGESVAGTLKYAPPEQIGESPGVKSGSYSDVYSFGKTCCYALFRTTEPKRRQWATIPEELADVLEKCIEQDIDQRHSGFESVLPVLEALAQPRPGDLLTIALSQGVEMKFAWVPPGTFLMGSPASEKERAEDEQQHLVTLTKGFFLGSHPVSQAQWVAVKGSNPSRFGADNHPVEQVSWHDCVDFCRLLSDRTGKRFRLPTEAEWTYACRAGTTTPFQFGETISTHQANYDGNQSYGPGTKGVSREQTTPGGAFPPNAWGLSDMHGNVWEWCSDMYPRKDKDAARVVRGGSWVSPPRRCRSAYRGADGADIRDAFSGCRVLLSSIDRRGHWRALHAGWQDPGFGQPVVVSGSGRRANPWR